MVGDRERGANFFEQGCERHRCRACCGAEEELRRAIGPPHLSAGAFDDDCGYFDGSKRQSPSKSRLNLQRLGRMPSTILASDARAPYLYQGSCAYDGTEDACNQAFCGVEPDSIRHYLKRDCALCSCAWLIDFLSCFCGLHVCRTVW